MIWYLTGFLWILQIYFWGLGLTWWIVPARWRRFWPAFCPMLGLALQSFLVWGAAHTALPGTDSYALASLLVPSGLLAGALWRMGVVRGGRLLLEVRKWWAVALIMAASLVLQLLPFTRPPGVLTSIAIGSCDAADYAAGARVFKEHSSRDRSGFLGNAEVVQVLQVDNFYDFWLRINHFTPSALIAFNASLFGLQPYQMVSLLGAVLLALNLPAVFWLARSCFRFNQPASLAVTLIYGFSPMLFYAVYQVALGQLLAAPAVALLTWTGVQAFRASAAGWKHCAAYSGLLLACNWLILGSYNFFILFAYIPLIAYLGPYALWMRAWRRAVRWAVFVGSNLLACGVLFPGRVMSLADRFFLFSKTPFGWRMPAFRPDGWYGSFADGLLHPAEATWSLLFGVACLATLGWALVVLARARPKTDVLAAACVLPALCGYAILLRKQELSHDNSSYDAYKLFCCFYPGLLAGLCLWVHAPRGSAIAWRIWTAALCAVLIFINIWNAARFNSLVRKINIVVDPPLAQIAEAERLPEVASVNVCLTSYWARMWANYFLLRKPQYFPLPTYEGRRITPLRGQWDLRDALIFVRSPDARDVVELNSSYYLLNRQSKNFLDVQFGEGWYPPEHYRNQDWCWSKGSAQIAFRNASPLPVNGAVRFSARSESPRRLQVFMGSERLWEGQIGVSLTDAQNIPVQLPSGASFLRFETPDLPLAPISGETRALSFALFHFEVALDKPTADNPKNVSEQPAAVPSTR